MPRNNLSPRPPGSRTRRNTASSRFLHPFFFFFFKKRTTFSGPGNRENPPPPKRLLSRRGPCCDTTSFYDNLHAPPLSSSRHRACFLKSHRPTHTTSRQAFLQLFVSLRAPPATLPYPPTSAFFLYHTLTKGGSSLTTSLPFISPPRAPAPFCSELPQTHQRSEEAHSSDHSKHLKKTNNKKSKQ